MIYQQRNELLESADVADTIRNMIRGEIEDTVRRYVPTDSVEEQWDIPGLEAALLGEFQIQAPIAEWLKAETDIDEAKIRERLADVAESAWKRKEELVGPDILRPVERSVMLQTLDHHWREHLAALDHLRQGIHLRGYAQKNPKQEYKREAFELFSDMLDRIKTDVVKFVLTVQVRSQEDVQAVEPEPAVVNVKYQHADYEEALATGAGNGENVDVALAPPPPFVRAGEKVGRNDPCPCGSGKKYKHCHGRLG